MLSRQLENVNAPAYDHYVFSKIAASKILGINPYLIIGIDPPELKGDQKYCKVHLRYPPTSFKFVKISAFKAYFVESRKDRSSELLCEKTASPSIFSVPSARTNEVYKVKLDSDRIICTCKDWEVQDKVLKLKTPTCKHCYRVLTEIGHSSLSDYLTAKF